MIQPSLTAVLGQQTARDFPFSRPCSALPLRRYTCHKDTWGEHTAGSCEQVSSLMSHEKRGKTPCDPPEQPVVKLLWCRSCGNPVFHIADDLFSLTPVLPKPYDQSLHKGCMAAHHHSGLKELPSRKTRQFMD